MNNPITEPIASKQSTGRRNKKTGPVQTVKVDLNLTEESPIVNQKTKEQAKARELNRKLTS